MKNRVFRALCALVLVCFLVVSWSPIRAMAMMPVVGWDGLAWNLADIIASGAIGIGLCPGSVPDDWNQMISDAKQACQEAFGLTGDLFKIYSFFNGSGYTYYAKADFAEWLRSWLFASDYLHYDYPITRSGTVLTLADGKTLEVLQDCYHVEFVSPTSGSSNVTLYEWVFSVPNSNLTYYLDGSDTVSQGVSVAASDTPRYRVYQGASRTVSATVGAAYPSIGYKNVDYTENFTWRVVRCFTNGMLGKKAISTVDISLGNIASPDKLLSDAYPEWVQNSVYIPAEVAGTEEDVLALPLGLGQTLTETQSLTQEQVWAGESTLKVDIQEALEGTVSGIAWADFTAWFGQKLEWIPKYILEGITALFVPKADFLEAKVAGLKARFPFIDGIIGLGEFVSESLSYDAGPPVLYVDFGPATIDTFGHRKYLLTNFSWYAPYKSTVDALMSSILWAFYGWRIFVRLPSIIGGEGGQVINVAFHSASARNAQEAERDRKKHKGG